MDGLELHLLELEELVKSIRLDVDGLKSGNKKKSVEARKRLSVVGKLSSTLRSECLEIAKPAKIPKISGEFAVEEVATVEVLLAAPVEVDNIVHTPVEVVVDHVVLTPDEKNVLHTICVDALQAAVEAKKLSVKKSSLNPRARAARSTKTTKPCGAC